MLRNISHPVDERGFEGGVGVETAGDGPVDDGLLLLVQHLDQSPPIMDEAGDLAVHRVEVAYYAILFFARRQKNR